MTLIDAIKSGKRFRRVNAADWLHYTHGLQWPDHGGCRAPNSIEMLADDWEIEEPTVTINRAQFDQAFNKAVQRCHGGNEIVWRLNPREVLWQELTDLK